MQTKSLIRLLAAVAAIWLSAIVGAPWIAKAFAQSDGSDATLLAEVRSAITLHGKPIPPEVFRDFGDGDIADFGRDLGHRRYRGGDRQQSLCRRHQEGGRLAQPEASQPEPQRQRGDRLQVHRRDGHWAAGRARELQRRRFRDLAICCTSWMLPRCARSTSTASFIAAPISLRCAASSWATAGTARSVLPATWSVSSPRAAGGRCRPADDKDDCGGEALNVTPRRRAADRGCG